MNEEFFWGGRYSPGVLFIGTNNLPEIPSEGLLGHFFKSRNQEWCFDLTGERGYAHRLWVDTVASVTSCQEYLKGWSLGEYYRLPGIVDQKSSSSCHSKKEQVFYTVTEADMTLRRSRELYIQGLTGIPIEGKELCYVSVHQKESQEKYCKKEWIKHGQYGTRIIFWNKDGVHLLPKESFFVVRVPFTPDGVCYDDAILAIATEERACSKDLIPMNKGNTKNKGWKIFRDERGILHAKSV